MIIQPLPNQTLLDIALQYLGDAGQAYGIAALNDLNVTDSLAGVSELILPDVLTKKKVVKFLTANNVKPASEFQKRVLPLDWLADAYCTSDGGIELFAPSTGGVYTGDGISFFGGSYVFDPSVAGAGSHFITYEFFDRIYEITVIVSVCP